MIAEIKKHIDSMRLELLDYANYHARKESTGFDGVQILEEAIYLATGMPEDQLLEMCDKTARGKYKEIDFYIVRLIDLSCEVFGREAKKYSKDRLTSKEMAAIQEATREERLNAVNEWQDFIKLCLLLKAHHE